MRRVVFAPIVVAALALGGLAVAQIPADPVEAVEYREGQMRMNGASLRTINGFIREGAGTWEDVEAATANLESVAAEIAGLFPAGTEQGVSDSDALPLIWEDVDGFQERIVSFQDAVASLAAVVEAGDEAGLPAAFGAVGQTCAACHDTYRAD